MIQPMAAPASSRMNEMTVLTMVFSTVIVSPSAGAEERL